MTHNKPVRAEVRHIWGRTVRQLKQIQSREGIPTLAATIDYVVTRYEVLAATEGATQSIAPKQG